jgi:hypothetical protein
MPMNSVTMVNALSRKRSMTLNAPPKFAEPLENEPRVADARDGAEPQHHFLIHIEHGDQQHQRPQQGRAIVLTRLRIGAERAGVVVADHHDESRSQNCEQRAYARPPAVARTVIIAADCSERAIDIADMRFVEDGGLLDRHR